MCNRLNDVVAAARAFIVSLDVDALTGSDASTAFSAGAELERLGASIKILVTPKVAASGTWARAGHRSPEEWMARASGTSVGQAKATIETAKRVEALPRTAAAVRAGELSLAQVAAVSEAAAANPASESGLLAAAGTEGLKGLQQQARRVVLDSRGSVEERYERQRRLRSFTSWTDDEGMTAGRFRLTPDAGAAVINKIRAEADRHFRQAYKEGRREGAEAYAADAFTAIVTGEGLIDAKSASKGAEVVVVVSHEALRQGQALEGELCEVPGFGAIPVSRVREMLPDAFLKGVVADGTRITHVRHFGRKRPAEVDTALLATAVISRGEVRCAVEGCGRTAGIQWDHKQPFARGGPTSSDNLHPMCGFDNREKEAGRVVGTADGKWVWTAGVARRRNPP